MVDRPNRRFVRSKLASPLEHTMLTITARITANEGRTDDVLTALRELVAATRREAGCAQYDLHRSHLDANVFFIFENWETRAHWEAHMQTAHIAAFRERAETIVASLDVDQLEKLV